MVAKAMRTLEQITKEFLYRAEMYLAVVVLCGLVEVVMEGATAPLPNAIVVFERDSPLDTSPTPLVRCQSSCGVMAKDPGLQSCHDKARTIRRVG